MRTIVIGAGPAGMNAAIHAASENNEVIIIEKNEKAGKKLFITGKGRCNVTNNCSEREFINHVVSNPKFLFSAIHRFSSKHTMEFFESRGVPLVTERGNRVFPKSYHAYDITDGLVKECRRLHVRFEFNTNVLSIQPSGSSFVVRTDKGDFPADAVVVATGGLSYPSTGSTGDGYRFAKRFNHTILPTSPALTGIRIKESIPRNLHGFALKNVSFSVKGDKFKHSEFGEMTFYDNYLDGPIIITTSSFMTHLDPSGLQMEIDFKPALNEEVLFDRIAREVNGNPNGTVEDLLRALLPAPMIQFFKENTDIDYRKECHYFSKKERLELIHSLKHFSLTFDGLMGYERAIVTSGGVSTKEIDSKTMESKIMPNLYFVGEVLDVDALTGGFNIQIALSTGASAGDAIKEKAEGSL